MLLARLVLKEPITLYNSIAIILGFLGVLFVAQPKFILDMIQDSQAGMDSIEVSFEEATEYSQPGTIEYFTVVMICIVGAMCAASVYVVLRKSSGSVHYQVFVFYYSIMGGMLDANGLC